MQLYYRGIPYESSPTSTAETGTEHIGRFLGQPFPIKAGTNPQSTVSTTLRYRGIEYRR